MKRPDSLKRPVLSLSAKLRACVLSDSGEEDGKMAAALRNRPVNMNVVVIGTFNIGVEGFNGVRLIKTDRYYRLGWVCFAATSMYRYRGDISAGQTRRTFQNKPQVSFRISIMSRPFRLSCMLCCLHSSQTCFINEDKCEYLDIFAFLKSQSLKNQ